MTGTLCWVFGLLPELHTLFPATTPAPITSPELSIAGATLAGFSVAFSLTVNRLGLRRSWSYLAGGLVVVGCVALAAFQFLNVDLLLIAVLFSAGVSLLLIQVNRLWSLDRQMSRTLFTSSVNSGDSTIGADARLMSGLKLLNTVLPLNEAVVFNCVESNSLEAVARYKGPGPNAQDPRRNSVWRAGIKLCQQAITKGKIVSQTDEGHTSSTVAVPLRHEGETAGALLIRPASAFVVDDTALLEAVGSQFARNLKRESFSQNSARTQ